MQEQWLPPIHWEGDAVAILDQRILPHHEKVLRCTTPEQVIGAIKTMAIRGAPAVGVAGALALALGAKSIQTGDAKEFRRKFSKICHKVREARPTGANLGWAVERLYSIVVENPKADIFELQERILAEDQIEGPARTHRRGLGHVAQVKSDHAAELVGGMDQPALVGLQIAPAE